MPDQNRTTGLLSTLCIFNKRFLRASCSRLHSILSLFISCFSPAHPPHSALQLTSRCAPAPEHPAPTVSPPPVVFSFHNLFPQVANASRVLIDTLSPSPHMCLPHLVMKER